MICPRCGGGRLRTDGSCPFELCPSFRKSKRPTCGTWLKHKKKKNKDDIDETKHVVVPSIKADKEQTPSQRTPLRRVIRKRIWVKRAARSRISAAETVEAVFSSRCNDVSTQTQKETAAKEAAGGSLPAAPSSSALQFAGGEGEQADTIQDMIDQCHLVPEKVLAAQHCFFNFRTASSEPSSVKHGSLQYLAALVAFRYSVEVRALGEPRALAIYSTISGILQKLPPTGVFLPAPAYLAALFYIAWELAGTASAAEPAVIAAAPMADVMACVFKVLNYMLAK